MPMPLQNTNVPSYHKTLMRGTLNNRSIPKCDRIVYELHIYANANTDAEPNRRSYEILH